MNDQDLIYRIGITLIKGIGIVTAKQVIETLGDASFLFQEKAQRLERIPGISRRMIAEIHRPEVLRRAEQEVAFIEKNKITPLYIREDTYPSRLKECVDAPVLLYFKGTADLNAQKIISIVGTRNASPYGKEMTENLVQDIARMYPGTIIVSGLAYGIDICAHKAALKNALPTVGVLAHGLDRIYPPAHRSVAVEMLEQGGLLTDFMSETNPDRQNFVKRNRIVAGIADCTVVVESAGKGGALITAGIADSYNKDVFAVPGKATDVYSAGCNSLIKYKKAALVTCAEDIFREMCWNETQEKRQPAVQRNLFPDLTSEEQAITEFLAGKEHAQLNTICVELNLPVYQLAPLLFELEMKGIVRCMPGGMYRFI
ncbi:MAG: DNA-processing protein DprA [Dysgonamonadaceae bacterium]|jgi:DNA processing protein|nr:DNA-processing protein DprA [Dysgonamonadaceae bacterium]